MTKLIKLYIILALFSSCVKGQYDGIETKMITIEYANEINGYSVKGVWKPDIVKYDHVIGPAIIEFQSKKDTTSFTLLQHSFSVLKSKLPFSYSPDSLEIVNLNNNNLKLFYDENNLKVEGNFGTTNEPFFFQDLDFDNTKELIFASVGNGQRGVASFEVYKHGRWGYYTPNDGPLAMLDQLSKIDYKNKQIVIYGSGGGCANNYEIYKWHKPDSYYGVNFTLETIIEQQRDDRLDKCYELTYKVVSQPKYMLKKQLISKKEIKRN